MFIEAVDMDFQKQQNMRYIQSFDDLKELVRYLEEDFGKDIGVDIELYNIQFDGFGMSFFVYYHDPEDWCNSDIMDLSKVIYKCGVDKYKSNLWWFVDASGLNDTYYDWYKFIHGVVIRWNLGIKKRMFWKCHGFKEKTYQGKELEIVRYNESRPETYGYKPINMTIDELKVLFEADEMFV